jgi:cytochrome P450
MIGEAPKTEVGVEDEPGAAALFVPPRPPTLPRKASLGDFLKIGLRSTLSMFREGSYDTLAVGRVHIPTLPFLRKRPLYIIRGFELLREVLVRRADEFPKSALMDDMLRMLTGYSIFVSNGEVWRRQRRLMEPAFEQARIRDVFPMMLDAVDACAARLEAHAVARPGQPVEIDIELTHFAADVIFRTIFSEPMDAEGARRFFEAFEVFQQIAYAHGLLRLGKFPTRLLPSYWRAKRSARVIREILEAPIARRMQAIREGRPTPTNDILASLIGAKDPDGTGFSEAELLDQVSMLFLAGHETSAAGLAWALYLLANCPHLQDRLHAEAAGVYGRRAPQFGDMKKLAFARDVFREALRLYPPVATVVRDATRPETMGTRQIAPGEVLFVPIWLMHRHKAHWDRPDAFDPDRFETEAGREGLRCAYLPFSMGPRVCAGASFALQEATLVLSALALRLRFKPLPGHTPEPVSRLTLRSANGVRLIVEPR